MPLPLADERLDGRRRVDVGDRNDAGDADAGQFLPAGLELVDRRHVGHRAAGREVRQDDLLVRRRKHVGALGHEMHAAEHDELGFRMRGGLARQAERIAGVVGEPDHLVALVVMTENHQPAAERRLRRRDPPVELGVGQAEIPLGKRLALRDLRLFELRQDRDERRHLNFRL